MESLFQTLCDATAQGWFDCLSTQASSLLTGQNAAITGGVGGLLAMAFRSFRSRITIVDDVPTYFTSKYQKQLAFLPVDRGGYSDRIAYLLAEMSYLAYYEFERAEPRDALVQMLTASSGFDTAAAEQFVDGTIKASRATGGEGYLREVLERNGFELLKTLNQATLQGFICRNTDPERPPFLVVAFRGSEQKVGDWLTNVDAKPESNIPEIATPDAMVHSGFYNSFKRAQSQIEAVINGEHGETDDGVKVPVFFTGHSLGGAWACLATALAAPLRNGGCYTFGAPRVGNYEFYFHVRSPMFRIVNSADVVPRLPPGPVNGVLSPAIAGAAEVTKMVPFLPELLKKVANLLDKLKDYRHYGDQRYLTDVTDERFQDTKLLHNPPFADRSLWFWKGILAGITYPIKSHSIAIYRDKLGYLAETRNG